MEPSESSKRIILIDNLREHLASESIESLITSPEISGHQMYAGYRARPNVSTWILTANGASLSRDLAERCVTIHLKRPEYRGSWESDVDRFIDENIDAIHSDIAGKFATEPTPLAKFNRWSAWEAEILGRLEEPAKLQELIAERSKAVDADDDDANAIMDYFAERLKFLSYTPDSAIVHIPSRIATAWLADAIGQKITSHGASRTIDRLHKSGSLPRLSKNPSRANGRGLLWTGPNATGGTDYDLQTRADNNSTY